MHIQWRGSVYGSLLDRSSLTMTVKTSTWRSVLKRSKIRILLDWRVERDSGITALGFSHLHSSTSSTMEMSFKFVCQRYCMENKRSHTALHHIWQGSQALLNSNESNAFKYEEYNSTKLHSLNKPPVENRTNVYCPWQRKWYCTQLVSFERTSQQLQI